jgi:hypothetical protein
MAQVTGCAPVPILAGTVAFTWLANRAPGRRLETRF